MAYIREKLLPGATRVEKKSIDNGEMLDYMEKYFSALLRWGTTSNVPEK